MSMLSTASFYFSVCCGVPGVNHQVTTLEPLGSPKTSLFLEAEAERWAKEQVMLRHSYTVRLNMRYCLKFDVKRSKMWYK